jgi:hypothetical protein
MGGVAGDARERVEGQVVAEMGDCLEQLVRVVLVQGSCRMHGRFAQLVLAQWTH